MTDKELKKLIEKLHINNLNSAALKYCNNI